MGMMIESASTTISTYTVLCLVAILKVTSSESSSNNLSTDDLAEHFDWSWLPPKPDNFQTSLGCVLFSHLGCDAECFVATSAYHMLGTGICNSDQICVCNFAMETTLDRVWSYKFALEKDQRILRHIGNNLELSKKVHRIFLEPFQTGEQIKKKLQQDFPDLDFEQLTVTDKCPAAEMPRRKDGKIESAAITTYINEKLPRAIELSNQELYDTDYQSALIKFLKDYKDEQEQNQLQLLLHQIRRLGNSSLNSVVRKHSRVKYDPAKNTKDTRDVDLIIDTVIDTLIKRAEPVFFQRWTRWLGNKFSCWTSPRCNSCEYDFSADQDDFLIPPRASIFQLPGEVYDELSRKAKRPLPRNLNMHGQEYKLRYRKNDHKTLNLNWIKKGIQVSIFKDAFSNVNQNWNFGKVKIYLVRSSDGGMAQNWDFGEYTYQYQYVRDADGHGTPYGKWSDGQAREEKLNQYKEFINEWCEKNVYLVKNSNCVIHENKQQI